MTRRPEPPATPPPPNKWTNVCDLSWHDDAVALVITLPSGGTASACLDCLSDAGPLTSENFTPHWTRHTAM